MAITNYYAINNSLYINGFQLAWASNSTLTVQPGICRDSTNNVDISVGNYLASNAVATTVSSAFKGVNGLDAGTVANSTWYAVHAIDDSTQIRPGGFLLSTSATAPLMPFGYDSFRRIGWALTNGAAQFILFYQFGSASNRLYQWDARVSVVAGGLATAFSAVSLIAAVPPQSCYVNFSGSYSAHVVPTNQLSIRPSGSAVAAANAPVIIGGSVIDIANKFPNFRTYTQLSFGNPSIDYVTTSASDVVNLSVVGFDDAI